LILILDKFKAMEVMPLYLQMFHMDTICYGKLQAHTITIGSVKR